MFKLTLKQKLSLCYALALQILYLYGIISIQTQMQTQANIATAYVGNKTLLVLFSVYTRSWLNRSVCYDFEKVNMCVCERANDHRDYLIMQQINRWLNTLVVKAFMAKSKKPEFNLKKAAYQIVQFDKSGPIDFDLFKHQIHSIPNIIIRNIFVRFIALSFLNVFRLWVD